MVGLTVREIAFCIEQKIDFIIDDKDDDKDDDSDDDNNNDNDDNDMTAMMTIMTSIITMLMRRWNVLVYDNTSTINFLLCLLNTMHNFL